jgi:hypothetical protein
VKIGLAGNLRDFEFTGHDGVVKSGADVDYNGSPAGASAPMYSHSGSGSSVTAK